MAGTEDERKRAENLVWTAAGDYAFTPDFLSFTDDGSADLYMNLVIGLAHKWLGRPTEALLEEVSRSRRAAILGDTLWLGIESYVYARELPSRPALETLRAQHAEAYFARLQNLNRQQWMAENKRLLDQQTIRWSRVLGRKTRVYAPDRRALAAALELDPTLRADEVAATLRTILMRFFAYRGEAEVKPVHIRLNTVEAWILQHVFRTEHQHTDTLMMKNTYAANASVGTPVASDAKHGGAGVTGERAYITACFGRSLYTDAELQQLEARLCVGGHRGCHVYVTDGKFGMGSSDGRTWLREKSGAQMNDITRTNQRTEDRAGKASGTGSRTDVAASRGGFFDSETAKVRQDSAQQALANRRFFESEGELARSLVRRLSARLELTLSDLRENVAVTCSGGPPRSGARLAHADRACPGCLRKAAPGAGDAARCDTAAGRQRLPHADAGAARCRGLDPRGSAEKLPRARRRLEFPLAPRLHRPRENEGLLRAGLRASLSFLRCRLEPRRPRPASRRGGASARKWSQLRCV